VRQRGKKEGREGRRERERELECKYVLGEQFGYAG
jgi:hypothetical protein